jgi:hypothetical protein
MHSEGETRVDHDTSIAVALIWYIVCTTEKLHGNLQGAGEEGWGYRVGALEFASQGEARGVCGTEDLRVC